MNDPVVSVAGYRTFVQKGEKAIKSVFLSMLPCVPQPQDINTGIPYFVTNFIFANNDAPHFAPFKLKELFTYPWICQQSGWCFDKRLHCSGGGWVDNYQEVMQPFQIGEGLACPLKYRVFYDAIRRYAAGYFFIHRGTWNA